jgi:hypothetical protein
VQLGDVVRAAMSEVEEYQRVQVGSTPSGALSGGVATDIVHLLAELLDNSLRASPPDTRVRITFARAVDGGVLLEVTDQGIGIPAADLAVINERLASGGQVGPETARHMGLFVASRLSARHGLTVRLRSSLVDGRPLGITASVHVPANLLMSPVEMDGTGPQVRLDTAGLPQVTVVQSGEMPQLVAEPATSVLKRLRTPLPAAPGQAGSPAEPGPTERVQVDPVPTATPVVPTPAAPVAPPVSALVAPPTGSESSSSVQTPAPAEPRSGEPETNGQTIAPSGLPQRIPGAASGLPQRTPGASGAPRPASAPQVAVEKSPPQEPIGERPDPLHPDDPNESQGTRHRYRSNPVKTASFFQNRPSAPPTQDVTATGTPIFSGMVSDWLTDPTQPGGSSSDWNTAADAGWQAAEQASVAPVERHTQSGLPQRMPGRRLVPGSVDNAEPRARLRDPESVRDNLSRHQMGIRAGRAAGRTEGNSNEGDR